jgi:hypothetical protein
VKQAPVRTACAALGLLCVLICAPQLHAQQPALSVSVDAHDYRALVRLGPVLANKDLMDAAMGGLPVRLRVRTELWHDGYFDKLEGTATWSAVVVYEPLRERFFVRGLEATGPARSFSTFEQTRAAVEGELPMRLRATKPGRYYYTSTLEIETLSVSDLQELERWLQGEMQPAVAGDQSIPGAIGAGAKRLLIRVLGVPNRRVEARSERFRIPDREQE